MDKHHIAIVFTFMMSDEWDWIFFTSQFSLKSCGCDIFWDLYQANIFSDTTTMLDYNVVHILPLSKKNPPNTAFFCDLNIGHITISVTLWYNCAAFLVLEYFYTVVLLFFSQANDRSVSTTSIPERNQILSQQSTSAPWTGTNAQTGCTFPLCTSTTTEQC